MTKVKKAETERVSAFLAETDKSPPGIKSFRRGS